MSVSGRQGSLQLCQLRISLKTCFPLVLNGRTISQRESSYGLQAKLCLLFEVFILGLGLHKHSLLFVYDASSLCRWCAHGWLDPSHRQSFYLENAVLGKFSSDILVVPSSCSFCSQRLFSSRLLFGGFGQERALQTESRRARLSLQIQTWSRDDPLSHVCVKTYGVAVQLGSSLSDGRRLEVLVMQLGRETLRSLTVTIKIVDLLLFLIDRDTDLSF